MFFSNFISIQSIIYMDKDKSEYEIQLMLHQEQQEQIRQ